MKQTRREFLWNVGITTCGIILAGCMPDENDFIDDQEPPSEEPTPQFQIITETCPPNSPEDVIQTLQTYNSYEFEPLVFAAKLDNERTVHIYILATETIFVDPRVVAGIMNIAEDVTLANITNLENFDSGVYHLDGFQQHRKPITDGSAIIIHDGNAGTNCLNTGRSYALAATLCHQRDDSDARCYSEIPTKKTLSLLNGRYVEPTITDVIAVEIFQQTVYDYPDSENYARSLAFQEGIAHSFGHAVMVRELLLYGYRLTFDGEDLTQNPYEYYRRRLTAEPLDISNVTGRPVPYPILDETTFRNIVSVQNGPLTVVWSE